MIKTTTCNGSHCKLDMAKVKSDGLVYLICNAEHYLYIGSTFNHVADRLLAHRQSRTRLGIAIAAERPTSLDWSVYVLDKQSAELLSLGANYGEHINHTEQTLINLFTPAFNYFDPLEFADGSISTPYERGH